MELPSYPGHNDALWETLLELANAELHEWTLIIEAPSQDFVLR